MAGKAAPVYRITGAGAALSEEQSGRTRRYLISMGIRTLCFLGAIVVGGPLRWVLIVGAVCLPYVAVIFANAGKERRRSSPVRSVDITASQLPPGGSGPPESLGPN
jgi:hypothetical protein